ncbi:uncharacterized protein MYCFIDRAFT_58648 [Pseudocercospora fijiensis CIRAD86]|uniref:SCP domain-containing protein n=1 Tax=Pseudocercospora fijiensis (strain CIRAD86) TaxID=383855 RepID=M3ARY7_PSEFD|nr:uncharacterized protein MYCFIDRAFT_58648 [Pseudocercospora fijiensis CIRAD86]EME79868.1 hypothetical protein MYCFIDRAFT_58648 [Pseudocercospora fijiensis CIRAD86]
MRLSFVVAALLSSTVALALPAEDLANNADKGPRPGPRPSFKPFTQVKNAHYAHGGGLGSHNAVNHFDFGAKQRPAVNLANWAPLGYSNDQYQDRVLKHHNYHRANHLAPPLEWDQSLAYTAQLVAQTCIYAHNQQFDPSAGQNIAAGYSPDQIGHVITDLFYNNEIPMFQNQWYREPAMTYFEQWGHMTQVCWKSTTHVGCATHYCPSGLGNVAGGVPPYFTVCNYKRAGNVATEYARNLSPPQGAAPINGNSF